MAIKLFNRAGGTLVLLTLNFTVLAGCGQNPKSGASSGQDAALSQVAGDLKAIHDNFVPASLSATSNQISGSAQKATNDNICGNDDFLKCQPKLLRAYVELARGVFGFSQLAVLKVATDLARVAPQTSGTVRSNNGDVSIDFNKRSFFDFDLLIKKSGQSVGFISARSGNYKIQLDVSVLDANNPQSRGGQVEADVTFSAHNEWTVNLFITNVECDPTDPGAPETAQLIVSRDQDLWKGSVMLYNGRSASFPQPVTCSTPSSESTGLAVYTDFTGNQMATRAALYVMRGSESAISSISTFGLNNLCANYPDLCQSIGTASGLDPATATDQMTQYLSALSNPYCATAGQANVTWNSDCGAYSQDVASAPYADPSTWIAPSAFHQQQVSFPSSL